MVSVRSRFYALLLILPLVWARACGGSDQEMIVVYRPGWPHGYSSSEVSTKLASAGYALDAAYGENGRWKFHISPATEADRKAVEGLIDASLSEVEAAALLGMSWRPIRADILTEDTTSIDWDDIPSGYTHLKIEVNARTSRAGTASALWLWFNGDYGANYNALDLFMATDVSTGAPTWNVTEEYGYGFGLIGQVPATSAPANSFGNIQVFIPSYAGSTHKLVSTQADLVTGSGFSFFRHSLSGFQWMDTDPITRIEIVPLGYSTGAKFVSGSSFLLYGLK